MLVKYIQNDVIGFVLRKMCKSKQMTDFIAWPSRCHDTIHDFTNGSCHEYDKIELNKFHGIKKGPFY
jgi:hypothetical protein